MPSAMSPRRSMAVLAFSASMPKESMVCAALARSSMPKGVLAAFSRSCATYSTPFASSPSMTEKLVWYASICALYLMAAVATCPSPCASSGKGKRANQLPAQILPVRRLSFWMKKYPLPAFRAFQGRSLQVFTPSQSLICRFPYQRSAFRQPASSSPPILRMISDGSFPSSSARVISCRTASSLALAGSLSATACCARSALIRASPLSLDVSIPRSAIRFSSGVSSPSRRRSARNLLAVQERYFRQVHAISHQKRCVDRIGVLLKVHHARLLDGSLHSPKANPMNFSSPPAHPAPGKTTVSTNRAGRVPVCPHP